MAILINVRIKGNKLFLQGTDTTREGNSAILTSETKASSERTSILA